MNCCICIYLYHYHTDQDLENFQHLKRFPLASSKSASQFHGEEGWVVTILTSIIIDKFCQFLNFV